MLETTDKDTSFHMYDHVWNTVIQ